MLNCRRLKYHRRHPHHQVSMPPPAYALPSYLSFPRDPFVVSSSGPVDFIAAVDADADST
jgi:hypothetical protein